MPQTKQKFAKNSAEVETSNGEITFIAARSTKNLNGWTYDVKSLQAQNSDGDYKTLSSEPLVVSIPLMSDHSASIKDKIGTIDSAHIETVDGVDQVVMHAKFFTTDEAQEVRQRILNGELTDVSITTDWGDGDWDSDTLENAHIVEVSVVYAGAEPKAKILAKNSVSEDEEDTETPEDTEEVKETPQPEETAKATEPEEEEEEEAEEDTNKPAETEEEAEENEENEEMPSQKVQTTERVATKEIVLNALAKLAENGAIRKMNRSQVIEAVKNEINLLEPDGETPYTVPDAIFTEILAATRPTDILETFDTIPVKRFTLMSEVPSDEDLARAGRWSKGEQKQIQESDLRAQKFATQFLYKLQELSYEDLQEDFGDLLYTYVRQELPQKVSEEEERAYIVGDGRAANAPRKITSIVSLEEAAEDATNVHVANYDGTAAASDLAAILAGSALLQEDGVRHLVANGATLGRLRAAGLDNATGLPFTNATIADAVDVEGLHKRSYVPENVVYIWTRGYVKRLTGGSNGETIEQYDIDYNNRKIEFIRPVGGGASGLYSAVKITLPGGVSA